jgi:hypothetical protein
MRGKERRGGEGRGGERREDSRTGNSSQALFVLANQMGSSKQLC